ncbi:MAG: twin-arginine translocation signal domain-containing protein [Alphaproteobacteria bacterium]|nr:twin-arginine translocation signal domain-containing protein [Alphaproteobacteria bacterium]
MSDRILSRRDVVKGAAVSVAAVGMAASPGFQQFALAEASTVIAGYGVTTSQLKDWSIMTKSLGLEMKWTGTDADIGTYMRDVISNDLGETHDIFIFDGGTEDILGPQGYYAVLDEDHPQLTLWGRTADSWKRTDLLRDEAGVQYGVPVIGNGDSFGYFPDKIGANPNGMDEIPWAMMYESDKTLGRVSMDRSWLLSSTEVGNFLKANNRAQIADNSDMTGEEARVVADYAVERKKAGQFRTLHQSFEEQVQLLSNREIDIINCWEPATKNANIELGADLVRYAFTVEGYYKWGHGAYCHTKALDRGNLDNIYKMLNYYMSGEYRAYQAEQRGYAGPNMDLGVEFATANGWTAEQIENLKWTETKVNKKFEKPFFGKPAAKHSAEMEEEWQRFLNA